MKAILVVDMPSDCNHCQFADFSNGQWECNQHKGGRIGESMKICSTPSWCPLKPIPKQFTLDEILMAKDVKTAIEMRAYNDCIDEIVGETE